jgi:23S rRNA pseudouridine2605 synthase
MSEDGVRLQKFIADAGLASRREAEALIRDREITINGKIAKLGDKVNPGKDHVKVRGKLVVRVPGKVVIAFYKPRGITATIRPEQKDGADQVAGTIWEFLGRAKERIKPIGRLDTDTEGLLLLTNDGDLGDRLNKAKFEVPKLYSVKIDGHLEDKKINRLLKGLLVEDTRVKALNISDGRVTEGKQWLRMTITDPRNRIIRKMFEAVGHPVDKVQREAFADITLKGLDRGQWRYLSDDEVLELRKFVGLVPGGRAIPEYKAPKKTRSSFGHRTTTRSAPRKEKS